MERWKSKRGVKFKAGREGRREGREEGGGRGAGMEKAKECRGKIKKKCVS